MLAHDQYMLLRRIFYVALFLSAFNAMGQQLSMMSWVQFRRETGGSYAQYLEYKKDFNTYHPADFSRNHVISPAELEAYINTWRSGGDWIGLEGKIPVDSVTQAALFKYQFEGYYFYFKDRFEGIDDFNDIADYYGDGSSSGITIGNGDESVSKRSYPIFPSKYYYYEPGHVEIRLDEPNQWTVLAVEEILPEGWTAADYQEIREDHVDHDSRWSKFDIWETAYVSFEDGRTIVRLGPFYKEDFIDPDRNYSTEAYQSWLPQLRYGIEHDNEELPTSSAIEGVQSYDGVSRPTLFREISPEYEKSYPQYNDFGVNISDVDVNVPNVDFQANNEYGVNNLFAWVTTGDSSTSLGKLHPWYEFYEYAGIQWVRCNYYQTIETSHVEVQIQFSNDMVNWYLLNNAKGGRIPHLDVGDAKVRSIRAPLCIGERSYIRLVILDLFDRRDSKPYKEAGYNCWKIHKKVYHNTNRNTINLPSHIKVVQFVGYREDIVQVSPNSTLAYRLNSEDFYYAEDDDIMIVATTGPSDIDVQVKR